MGCRTMSSCPRPLTGVSNKDGDALVFKYVCPNLGVNVKTRWQGAFSILTGWNKGPNVRRLNIWTSGYKIMPNAREGEAQHSRTSYEERLGCFRKGKALVA